VKQENNKLKNKLEPLKLVQECDKKMSNMKENKWNKERAAQGRQEKVVVLLIITRRSQKNQIHF
jgi:hypothetical protein